MNQYLLGKLGITVFLGICVLLFSGCSGNPGEEASACILRETSVHYWQDKEKQGPLKKYEWAAYMEDMRYVSENCQ